MALLEIDAVRKCYSDDEVLKGVSLSVDSHEVVCLIGASGSGKSTLLRCINGLETIEGGQIRFEGDVVSGPGGTSSSSDDRSGSSSRASTSSRT